MRVTGYISVKLRSFQDIVRLLVNYNNNHFYSVVLLSTNIYLGWGWEEYYKEMKYFIDTTVINEIIIQHFGERERERKMTTMNRKTLNLLQNRE